MQKLTFDYEGTTQISGVVKFIDYIIKNAEKLKNGELDQAYLFKLLEKVPDTDSKMALGKNNGKIKKESKDEEDKSEQEEGE